MLVKCVGLTPNCPIGLTPICPFRSSRYPCLFVEYDGPLGSILELACHQFFIIRIRCYRRPEDTDWPSDNET